VELLGDAHHYGSITKLKKNKNCKDHKESRFPWYSKSPKEDFDNILFF
jgi:hypothetical protein